jgi:predicted tellurium resistance membrane protein TerC
MELLTNPETWVALATLTVLEIVLGIDNIIFLSIITERLPAAEQERARRIGLGLAMGIRILLLLSISFIFGLTEPIATIAGRDISVRDLILIGGGFFLLWKGTTEIHESLEGAETSADSEHGGSASLRSVLIQVVLLDAVFSLDSVLTAVGMVDQIPIMIAAIVIAVGAMLLASGPLSRFVHSHPTVKMLALAFLLLVGVTLIADGLGVHIPKDYIYAAIAFAVFVEALNLRASSRRRAAVELRPTFVPDEPDRTSAPG